MVFWSAAAISQNDKIIRLILLTSTAENTPNCMWQAQKIILLV